MSSSRQRRKPLPALPLFEAMSDHNNRALDFGPEPAVLLADIRARVAAAEIDARGLALESGRLDELFGALTGKPRPQGDMSGAGEVAL